MKGSLADEIWLTVVEQEGQRGNLASREDLKAFIRRFHGRGRFLFVIFIYQKKKKIKKL